MKETFGELMVRASHTYNTMAINYTGFGLKIAMCSDLAKKLRDEPYAFDEDGKEEFESDIKVLADQLEKLYSEFLSNKEEWSR